MKDEKGALMGYVSDFLGKFSLIVAVFCCLSACTSVRTLETTNDFEAIESQATILVVEPDIELSLLTAAGLREARADWSEAGQANMLAAVREYLATNNHGLIEYEVNRSDAREVQLIKLHQAVGQAIFYHRFLNVPLPSKKDTFDWSLGPGVQQIAADTGADYALFLFARGAYASAGRQMLAIGLAVGAGALMNVGDSQAYGSLVDLQTGDIVWFNVAQTGPGNDMRKETGATSLVKTMLKDIPL